MYINENDVMLNYDALVRQGTATSSNTPDYKLIDYPIGKFVVRVAVTPSNQFLGIVEVSVNRDFRSFQERLAGTGFHEVEEFYREK